MIVPAYYEDLHTHHLGTTPNLYLLSNQNIRWNGIYRGLRTEEGTSHYQPCGGMSYLMRLWKLPKLTVRLSRCKMGNHKHTRWLPCAEGSMYPKMAASR